LEKRIVIMASFGDAHFFKLQIPNIIRTLKPTHICISEGLFPTGPETNLQITEEWKKKWCYPDDNRLAFDTEETQKIISDFNNSYSDVEIKWLPTEFDKSWNASECYSYSVSRFEDFDIEVNEGDIIFPYEPDMFHHEEHMDILEDELSKLKPNESIKSYWIDFIGNQYYTENGHWPEYGNPRERKLAIKFGTMDYYKSVIMQFQSQNYPMCKRTDIVTYHYCWFKKGPYLDLRYDLIPRNERYWLDWGNALVEMETAWKDKRDVVLRPSHNNLHRFVKYVELDHPREIKEHECWV